jgi:hypothetical protein
VPTLFHGTGQIDAADMSAAPGQINVAIGGGEFGRGFYTPYSEWHARRWALRVRSRLNGSPVVLRLDINDLAYGGLNMLSLDARLGLNLTEILDFWQAKAIFTTGCCDFIEGPIAGTIGRMQQKFESINAQTLLNSNDTVRTVVKCTTFIFLLPSLSNQKGDGLPQWNCPPESHRTAFW